MAQIYKVNGGFSEGFFSDMSIEDKSKHLARLGVTFLYNSFFHRTAVYIDSSVDTREMRMLQKNAPEVLESVSPKRFYEDLEECYRAIGYKEKEPGRRKTNL